MIGKAVNSIKKFLNIKDRRQETVADFHTTIIRVDDNFISSSSIVLDEMLRGNIYSLKEVIVSGKAEISGDITSSTASIRGTVYGNIVSIEFAEIKSTAIIRGNIRAKAISIERGAKINGSIRIEGEIDKRDLLAKIENRLPSNAWKEPAFITYILPEKDPVIDAIIKPEIRLPDLVKRIPASTEITEQRQPEEA
jgi:cytoskeletal protein CcmA (bactofilin family)